MQLIISVILCILEREGGRRKEGGGGGGSDRAGRCKNSLEAFFFFHALFGLSMQKGRSEILKLGITPRGAGREVEAR